MCVRKSHIPRCGESYDMQTPTVRHWALLGYLVFFWGFAFGLIAMALEAFHPVAVVWSRLTLGAVVMLLILRLRRGRIPLSGRWPLRMVLLSVTGNVVPFTLIAWAEQRVASGEVGLLMALMPIAILVMGHYFLEHERMTPFRLIGVAMGFAGVTLLMGVTVFAGSEQQRLWGQIAAVTATMCYAINGIYTKRLPGFDPVAITAGSLVAGSLILLAPALWLQEWNHPTLNPVAWGALLVLGVFSTGVATWVYFVVVSEVGPGFLSTINYLIPALAFTVGVVLLKEPVLANQLVALAAILAGVWLIQPKRPLSG